MKSGWVDRDAEAIRADGAKAGIDPELSLRIYTTRLLGRDPKLVLHGGGNTSLKTKMRDRFGAQVEVLRVKASGADMAEIEAAAFPAVRLDASCARSARLPTTSSSPLRAPISSSRMRQILRSR